MLLRAHGLSRRFGTRVLYEGVSLDLAEGAVLGLRGPSGSGKSSLLRLLARLDPLPPEARLALRGRDAAEWPAPGWRGEVLLVGQVSAPLPGTPRELAATVAGLHAQAGREADDAEALARAMAVEPGAWDRPWVELSAGERQRCRLALALSRRPAVLLLDEPTSAVDAAAVRDVERALAGRAAVIASHDDAQLARLADDVLELAACPARSS